jgi:tetrahydromethanopterin S-methyltransferase subunit G
MHRNRKKISMSFLKNLFSKDEPSASTPAQDGLENIKKYFGFMFEQGYEVYSAEGYLGTHGPVWEIVLRKQDLFVRFHAEQDFIEELSFRTSTQQSGEFTDIRVIVYALTGKKFVPNLSNSLKSFANLLRKHLDEIEAYFGGEHRKIEDRIKTARGEYYQAISPKEAKIIPILHYPLMGMVIILLVGVLTTLYMVLLDRLLSALSIDGDTYRKGMGIVSLLLAIGTVLIFRRLVK